MKTRTWSEKDIISAVKESKSVRQVIHSLGLVPAGGNYDQVNKYIKKLGLSTKHFTNKGWRKNSTVPVIPAKPINEILIKGSNVQSFKLKKRLFSLGLKKPFCEICHWSKKAPDGRIPVELDHINGNKKDNRLENLRILCPNCHSLQSTHRGLNKNKRPGGGIGIHATLKMS